MRSLGLRQPDAELLGEFRIAGRRVREYRRGTLGWRYIDEDGRVLLEFPRTTDAAPITWRAAA